MLVKVFQVLMCSVGRHEVVVTWLIQQVQRCVICLPVISSKGVTPVDLWGVALMAINTKGSLMSQSLWLAATYFFDISTTVRLVRSTWPEEMG